MPDQSTHPSPEELSAFNLGQLPPAAAAAVEDHISACDSCCETLLGLASNDTFVNLLKAAGQSSDDESKNPTFVTGIESRKKGHHATIPETLTEHSRYEIVRLIGKGGMGDVFQARHRMMDRTVALKVINHEFIRKPQAVDRFHREVKAAARLSHPNIVTAYDAEQAGDLHFLVMEYVDGVDLANLVKDRGGLPVSEACDFARQAAVGLQHAHEQGMVHRDIKPHNLMVTDDGTVKILDFGLASLAPEILPAEESQELSGELTAAGAIIGTPDFISPEQARDAHQADIRSDIYSLGATLYFLLSGRAPFAEVSVIEKLKHHAEQEPVPLENLQIEIPDELADVMRKMMAKDPQDRFQTPQEVADALAPFVDEHRTAAAEMVLTKPPTQSSGSGSRRIPRRLTWLAFFGFLCMLAGVFYIQLGKTTLKFEIADPSIEVRFGDEAVYFEDRGRSGGGKIFTIEPGTEQEFVVKQGGAVVETDSLVLNRGDKVVLSIDVVEGELKIVPDKDVTIDRQPRSSGESPRVAGNGRDSGSSSEITEVGRFNGHKGHVFHAVMSPDGKYGISCGEDKTIRIWDLKTQEQLRVLNGHEGEVFSLAVSGNGKLLASGGESGIIRLWNFPSGEFLAELKGHNGDVTELAFMPDGSHLLSFGFDKTLRLWNIESQQLDRTIPLGVWVDKLEPLWDNQRVMLSGVQSGNLGVVTYDLKKGETLVPHVSDKTCLAVGSDGRKTLVGSITAPLKVQDMETGKLIARVQNPLAKGAIDAAISPDGRFAITTTRYGTMYLWDLLDGVLIATAESETIGGSKAIGGTVGTVRISPDGRYALTAGREAGVSVWRLPDVVQPKPPASEPDATPGTTQEFTEVGSFEKHGRFAYNAVVSPDGKYAVSCGAYLTIRVWDLETQQEIRVLRGHKGAIAGLAVSATGRLLASGDKSGIIRLWNLPTGEPLGTLAGHNGFVSALAFLPDGRLLSAASDKTLRIWDVHQQKLLRTIDLGANVEKMEPLWDNRHVMLSGAHTGGWGVVKYDLEKGEKIDAQPSAESCLAVAGDRKTTLVGTVTGLLRVHNMESGKLIVQMADPRAKAARDAAILPGNRFAITTTRDGQMHLWNLAEGSLISSATADSIGTVTLSPDGRYALTIGREGGVAVWRLPELTAPKTIVSGGTHQGEQQARKQIEELDGKPYTELPPAPAVFPETGAELQALIDHIPQEGSDEEWKTFLAQHAPPLEGFPVEFMRKPLQLIAGLPEAMRQELLDRGYLKWRLRELDEQRRELHRKLIKEMLESALEASALDDQTIEKFIEIRQQSGDVGFVVADVPTTNSQIIVWYMQNPERPPMPIPMVVPISGVKDAFKDEALSKSVYKQVSSVDDKPYTDLLPLLKQADVQRLQGLWTVVKREANANSLTRMNFEISGNNWRFKDSSTGAASPSTFDIDPTQNPKHITLKKSSNDSRPLNGIYRFEGDELHINWSPRGDERPTRFQGMFYTVMRRKSTTTNHVLRFNGDSTAVSLPIRYDGSHPITLECTVLLEDHGERGRMLISDTHDAGINLQISPTDQKLLFSPRSERQAQPIAYSRETFPFGKKVHVAGVYTGQEVRLYLNGKLEQTVPVPDDFRFEPSPMKLAVGANPDGPASFRQSPIGLIDEVRISKVARYDEDFTPVERFETDEHTLALYHFDEGVGTIARDSSGNKLDGEIFGATWVEWPQSKRLTELFSLKGHEKWVGALAVSPDNRWIATGGGKDPQGAVFVWDGRTGELRFRCLQHKHAVLDACFSPDSTRLVTSGRQGEMFVWDFEKEKVVYQLRGHTCGIVSLAWSSDGRLIASGTDNWNAKEGAIEIGIWNPPTGERIRSISMPYAGETGPKGSVAGLQFLANDQQLLVTPHYTGNRGVQIYDIETGDLVRKITEVDATITAISPDGRIIATGHEAQQQHNNKWDDPENCLIRLWDFQTGTLIRELRGHRSGITGIEFTPDSRYLISASGDRWWKNWYVDGVDHSIRVWNVTTGNEVLYQNMVEPVRSIRLFPDGRRLVSNVGKLNQQPQLQIWQLPEVVQPKSTASTPEIRRQFEQFATALKENPETAWKPVIQQHSPILEEYPAATVRELLRQVVGLPEPSRQELLNRGYLKWRFEDLDPARRQSIKALRRAVLSASTETKLNESMIEETLAELDRSDTGLAVLHRHDSTAQFIVWYIQPDEKSAPFILPVTAVSRQNGEFAFMRSIRDQLAELKDKPYSNLPPGHEPKPEGDEESNSTPQQQ